MREDNLVTEDLSFKQDELPADQQVFLELNAELAQVWPNITEMKEKLPEAEKWNGVPGKESSGVVSQR